MATVKKSGGAVVEFQIDQELETPAPEASITLLLSIIKFARFEWAIEKATELGVSKIVPVIAERSEKRLVEATPKRLKRWERIAEEAAQQARRLGPPEIGGAVRFEESLEVCVASLRLLLDAGAGPLEEAVEQVRFEHGNNPRAALLIGPEGGLTAREGEIATDAGFLTVGLGPLILRTETAAVAALAVVTEFLRKKAHR